MEKRTVPNSRRRPRRTRINLVEFGCFLASQRRQIIATAGGRSTFRYEITPYGIEYTPRSGKHRVQQWHVIERTIAAYRGVETKTSDLNKTTYAASYFLSLIRAFEARWKNGGDAY